MTQEVTVINNDSELMDVTPPRTALTKLEHVRGEMARIYRQAKTGKIDTQDATRLAYILNSLAKIIEQADLEARIENLEKTRRR